MSKKVGKVKLEEKETDSALLSKNRIAGGYLPPALAERFSIYSVYKGVSRSHIVHELIENAMADAPELSEMVDDIAKRFLLLKTEKMSIERYKIIASRQLDKRKLSLDQIRTITDRMEELANERTSKKKKENNAD